MKNLWAEDEFAGPDDAIGLPYNIGSFDKRLFSYISQLVDFDHHI